MTDAPANPARRRAALAFVLVTVLLDVLSFGVVIPVFPRLFENFLGGDAAKAAALIGVLGTVWAAIQFFVSPVLGALSDRYGRRPVILLSNLGTGFDFLIMALAPNIAWLVIGRVLNAATAASFAAANAYVADVTTPEARAKSYGFMGAAFGLGFIVGPAIGGFLGQIDLRLPFFLGAALGFANFLYGRFVLPESLTAEHRRPFAWRQANPVGALKFLAGDRVLLSLACAAFLIQLAHALYPNIWVLYTAWRYDWSPATVGVTLATTGVLAMIVQGGLIQPIVKRFGERTTLLLGLVCWSSGFVWQGLAATGRLFLMAMPLGALAGLAAPALNAILSQRVSADRQGQLQGAQSGLQSISGLIGPGLYTGTLALAMGPAHGAVPGGLPFFIAAGLLLLALALAWRGARVQPPSDAPAATPVSELR